MKKLIVAVIVIVALLGAVPFVNGVIMERTVQKAVEDFNTIYAAHPAGYSIDIVNYDRSYLTTDFSCQINLGVLKNFYGVDTVIVKSHARHGYTRVVSTTNMEENPWISSFIDNELQGQNPLHVQTVYSLFGGIESRVDLDAFSIEIDGEHLEVKPGEMVVETDGTLKNFVTSANWQGMTAGEKIELGEITVTSDVEMISELIWDGDAVFNVTSLKATDKNETFEMTDLTLEYLIDAERDENRMGGNVRLTLDSFQAGDKKVDDASVLFVIKGIHLDGYEEFMKAYFQVASNMMSKMDFKGAGTEKTEAVMKMEAAQIGLQMMSAYEKMLKKDLEIQISDLQLKLAEGEVQGDVTLKLLKDMTFMQFAPMIYQPHLLLDIFYLKSDVRLPVSLTGENPKMLAPVYPGMQTGLFVKDGDYLVHSAETTDGRLFINGNEVVLTGP